MPTDPKPMPAPKSRSMPLLVALCWLSLVAAADAQEPVLLGRSGPFDGFLMPGNAGFANNRVALNDHGAASIRITSLGATGERGVWTGDGTTGQVVATIDPAFFVTDVDLNNDGRLVWAQTDSPANGIYAWNPIDGAEGRVTAQPLGTSIWGTVQAGPGDAIGYRATFGGGGRAWASVADGATAAAIHAAEASIQPGSPYSFLFTPAFNAAGQIGGKALLNAGGNRIILAEPTGTAAVIVQDQAADPTSPFSGFDNSPAVNDLGEFGFIAGTTDGDRGVFFGDGTTTLELAREGRDGIGDIEFFGPVIDNRGNVAFRAFEDGGRRAIWLANASGVRRLIGAGDLVESDLGTARIDSPSGVEFSGGLAINQSGQIAFVAVLVAPDNVNDVLGLGIFRIDFAAEVLFADGFED